MEILTEILKEKKLCVFPSPIKHGLSRLLCQDIENIRQRKSQHHAEKS